MEIFQDLAEILSYEIPQKGKKIRNFVIKAGITILE